VSFDEERKTSRVADTADDDALRCIVCDHRISARSLRCDRDGAHEHLFTNPGGFQYRIGCFVAAPGCSYVGPTEQAFSWFPGWSWQIAQCSACHAHVGWIYRLAGGQFHGLILDMLR
jgi:hypothetical protein